MSKIDCTVIIPTYKNYKTIERAVNSVLSQTKLPQKIIIIDDFSNDIKYEELLRKLANHPLVEVYFSKKNQGPGTSRNIGIKLSDTKYIAFLDSDDAWRKEKLETQFNLMEKYGYYLTCHESIIFESYNEVEKEKIIIKTLKKYQLFYSNIIQTRSVMMINDKKYFFKEGKKYSEDYLLWLEIILNNKRVAHTSQKLSIVYKEDMNKGLSSNDKNMLKGEKENFEILHSMKLITKSEEILLKMYYTFKYFVRKNKKIILKR